MSQIELIFIRHGEASDAWNNHPDPGLSKTGISQSNDLLNNKDLESLENYSFISSPKLRAIETAKPLVKKFNKELKIDNDFIDFIDNNDFSVLQNQSKSSPFVKQKILRNGNFKKIRDSLWIRFNTIKIWSKKYLGFLKGTVFI